MAVLPLPKAVEEKLRDLAAGIRRMRVLRGICWLALTLLLATLLAVGLDSLLELSGRTRTVVLGGWILGGIAAAWWLVGRRIYGRIPQHILAQAVEANYPSLAERLQTLVELSQKAEIANGSKAMMLMLARDTERRTARLNFLTAAPKSFTIRLAGVSTLVILLALAPFFVLPGSGDRVRRLIQPWHTPGVDLNYKIVVSSGDPTVKRGESVTLAGYAERTKPGEAIPNNAVVVLREKGSEKSFPMRSDDKAAFTFTKPTVNGDFEYYVGIGNVRSEWHTVSAVDPTQIAAGTTLKIRPPEYAKANITATSRDGLSELEALQFSTASFDLKFNLQVKDAALEWRPTGEAPNKPPERIAVKLNAERTGATAEFPIRTDGVLKWVLEGEKNIRTEIPLAVRTLKDMPPQFEKVVGFPSMAKEIRPDEFLVFDIVVRDDNAVSEVVLEYGRLETVGSQLPFSQPLPLSGLGTARAEGRTSFTLGVKFREGEKIVFRLRLLDNRSVPEASLTPQEITFPEKGWATLRITSTAKSLGEQEIQGQQLALHERIAAIRTAVAETAADLAALRPEMLGRTKLAADQSVRLTNDRERTQQCAIALEDLAKAADVVPELRGVSDAARVIAEQHLRKGEDLLRKTNQEVKTELRDITATTAQKELDSAVAKLDELFKLNARTGEQRRDSGKLAQLAEEQTKLAEDPAASAKKQQDLKDRLQNVVKESDSLRDANNGTDIQERREVAKKLNDLRSSLQKLDDDARDAEDLTSKKQLENVAKKQKELAEQIDALAKKTDAAARLQNAPGIEKAPSQNARDLIDQQKTTEALTEQEKAARDLDRFAEALGQGALERRDASKAAGQLERWQQDIRRRLDEAAKANPDEVRKKLKAEQNVLGKAIEQLPLPPSDELEKLRRESAERSANAAKELQDDPAAAPRALDKSADSLSKLGKQTPTNVQRNKAALGELEKLRREQDAIGRDADEALREKDSDELAKKLKSTAAKQDELSKKLAKLDTPESQERRNRAADSGRQASDELAKGAAKEIPASQKEAKRQLDRLKEELEGKTPADRAAGELARLQNELSENLERKAALAQDELQRLQRDQKEIQKQLGQLAAPEANGPLTEAKEAVQQAEAATREPMLDVDELKKKNKAAAESLDKLAEKLGFTKPTPIPQQPPDPANALPSNDDAKLARDLAKQQRELREQLSRTVTGTPKPDAEMQKLQKDHDKLAERAKQLSEQMAANPAKNEQIQKAADAAKEAGERIAEAGQNQTKNKSAEAAASRKKALDSLKQARESIGVPVDAAPPGKPSEQVAEASKNTREAEKSMNDALRQMSEGKPSGPSMANAADKLKRAAEKLAPGKGDGSGEAADNRKPKEGPNPSGKVSSDVKPSALSANLGKPWGELSGEVKAQMTQELKAKYGEDYARIIKLYFEQLAERK